MIEQMNFQDSREKQLNKFSIKISRFEIRRNDYCPPKTIFFKLFNNKRPINKIASKPNQRFLQ